MIRKIFQAVLIFMLTFSVAIHDAEAKRFGGGRSFGMQRSISSYSHASSPFTKGPLSSLQNARPSSPFSKWLGPLAGLATGGLLAYLLMGHGIGSGIMSWLLIGAGILLVLSFLRNRMSPVAQTSSFQSNMPHYDNPGFSAQNPVPVNFDTENFLRNAKVQFIRLQAAYDTKNLEDIRTFTTPEVFGEIQLQLQERGNEQNITEVVTLEANLLEATTEFQVEIASVQFKGLIREAVNTNPESFTEVWHFKKDSSKTNWLVAGIQQQ